MVGVCVKNVAQNESEKRGRIASFGVSPQAKKAAARDSLGEKKAAKLRGSAALPLSLSASVMPSLRATRALLAIAALAVATARQSTQTPPLCFCDHCAR